MAVLINHTNPYMRIYVPETNEYRAFRGGKLEVEKDDPAYPVLMAEASRNPAIVILESVNQCEDCGESFEGQTGKARLAKHRKEAHFDKWLADKDREQAESRNVELKSRAGVYCDVCAPAQEFADDAALAVHVSVVHAGKPDLDDEGNTKGEGAPAVSTAIPAAAPSES